MTSTTETTDVQAIQFNGLDDYLRIVEWMKDCDDTYALADEVRYTTPIMLLQTPEGTVAANPGDWIVRGPGGGFSVETRDKAETPTVRTYRIQYSANIGNRAEMFVEADGYGRASYDRPSIEFYRDGRTVAEVMSGGLIAIEEIPAELLSIDEREELEQLRELAAVLDNPDAVADLAKAMAETRDAAAQDRERQAQPGADWSTYADCPVCGKPTGESCVVGNLNLYRWPHRDRPLLAALPTAA